MSHASSLDGQKNNLPYLCRREAHFVMPQSWGPALWPDIRTAWPPQCHSAALLGELPVSIASSGFLRRSAAVELQR